MNWQDRTIRLIGDDKAAILRDAKVAVVGVGGVGSAAMEMLCRAGIGHLVLIDGDAVAPTNLNRQLISTAANIGQRKVFAAADRCRQINPGISIDVHDCFLGKSDNDKDLVDNCDFVVDAIDDVPAKISLISHCLGQGISMVSSMGAAGRTDPSKTVLADISRTFGCPLARTIRAKLREKGINKGLPVVFSSEKAVSLGGRDENGGRAFGTISYLPAVFGCFAAAYVIRSLCGITEKDQS